MRNLPRFWGNRGHYTILERAFGSEKNCATRNEFVMSAKLFHGFRKRNVPDAAGEEIAAGDVACGIATEKTHDKDSSSFIEPADETISTWN